jgi:hypothetical protein
VIALPAASAAAAMFVGNDAGAFVPKNTAESRTRPTASDMYGMISAHTLMDVVATFSGIGTIDRDLLDVEVLVRPRDLGGLLEAGVTGDPVGHRQRGQDREPDLLAATGTRRNRVSAADCFSAWPSMSLTTCSGMSACASVRETMLLWARLTSKRVGGNAAAQPCPAGCCYLPRAARIREFMSSAIAADSLGVFASTSRRGTSRGYVR